VVLAVSKTHRDGLARVIGKLAAVRYIYNPLDESLPRSRGSYDPFQLVFTSSPHKGLHETLQMFQAVRRRSRRFRLLITNPGYLSSTSAAALPAGVTSLGVVRSHRAVMEHVAASLCVFYPNYTVPEEFGLVYSESNAVGTPVLAHDHGSAREVLRPRDQAMDCRDRDAVVRRVLAWADGERPKVKARAEFAIDTVIAQWRTLLELGA
jgi:glycosyltransferase involved in cell wall biosynthesis